MSATIVINSPVSELEPENSEKPLSNQPSNCNCNSSSISSSSSDSNQIAFQETRGPRVGVQLTEEQANIILFRHLNCTCTSLDYVDRGYNNRTYIAHASSGNEYVIRLCGRYWDRWKTEREVATLCFIRLQYLELCNDQIIPVPRVYGFCSNRAKSGIGHEYILVERIPGVPLEQIWKSNPSVAIKELVFSQIAQILQTMQSITFKQIGSLTLTPKLGDTFGIGINPCTDITLADIHVGQHSDIMAGPFDNYIEYERAAILAAVTDLKKTPYMASSLDLIPRIEEFVQDQFSIGSDLFYAESMAYPTIALVHGDFEPRNIMIDPDTYEITGILDWEFAGAFPYYEDWFAGFEAFGAICDEAWTFNEPPTNPKEYDPRTEEMSENRELFFAQLNALQLQHQHGFPTPDKIPWLRQLYCCDVVFEMEHKPMVVTGDT